ncbi:hypothetical protein [Streptomyces cadmiisoli]|uniref:hypothetical protein n=1 Tax=Streptomyces cadmiisoli TaxID=2184053 RepID=UPI003661BD01
MSPVLPLLFLAGLSEAAGRVLPLVAHRPGVSRKFVIGLLLAGALVEGAVFALWPLTTLTLAELVQGAPAAAPTEFVWTPELIAPLMLAAVLAFPLLGPLLHLLLFIGVGAGLSDSLASATGLGWWTAVGCVTVAGVGLGVTSEGVRRLVARISMTGRREAMA